MYRTARQATPSRSLIDLVGDLRYRRQRGRIEQDALLGV